MAEERTVLVVEDNEKNLKLVRDVLEYNGFRTLAAGTGAQAIEMAASHNPDLILMDLQLPDMDGFSALAEIRARGDATVPAVALTAFAMRADAERVRTAGFDGYLTKPIDIRTFVEDVRRYCREGTR